MFDLHFHSTHSDGKLNTAELATIIRERNLVYCALTDHDTVNGIAEIKSELSGSNVTVIPGVELTALYKGNDVHVLAYDFDVDEARKILEERNRIASEQKTQELAKAMRLFRNEGFEVSNDLHVSPKKPAGLTVALDVYSNPVNQERLISKHGDLPDHQSFFDLYQAEGRPCATKRSGVTFEWIVERFSNIASDLVIAHPFVPVSFFVKPLSINDLLDLVDKGATGVEVYHDRTSDDQLGSLKRIVKEKTLHYTGGSDFHGKQGNLPLGTYGPDITIPSFHLKNHQYP